MVTSDVKSLDQIIKSNKTKRRRFRKITRKEIFIICIVILGIIGGVLGYLYYQNLQNVSTFDQVIADIKKIVQIKDNETVRVALINNAEDLKKNNPVFYANVKNGDYYVLFPETSKVLIYRKEDSKIVNFSSFALDVDLISENLISENQKPLKIEIRYTADVQQSDLKKLQDEITKASKNYVITQTNKTVSDNYVGLSLVLLNSKDKPQMTQNFIAQTKISAISQKLTPDEPKSDADIVLFIGKRN